MAMQHERLLIAALAGLIVLGGAIFALQPGLALSSSGPHASQIYVLDGAAVFGDRAGPSA